LRVRCQAVDFSVLQFDSEALTLGFRPVNFVMFLVT